MSRNACYFSGMETDAMTTPTTKPSELLPVALRALANGTDPRAAVSSVVAAWFNAQGGCGAGALRTLTRDRSTRVVSLLIRRGFVTWAGNTWSTPGAVSVQINPEIGSVWMTLTDAGRAALDPK